jgi:hypothetical protein
LTYLGVHQEHLYRSEHTEHSENDEQSPSDILEGGRDEKANGEVKQPGVVSMSLSAKKASLTNYQSR